ncbi:MAG: ABC transporter ATP-binding protein [Candidatus Ancillula sp.]|jgi:putative ABC transport system ATP-binding protein|nr:ABC transporter ATP-binding protein [Candidatus Ancillula sp.]
MAILELKNISYSYKVGKPVLKGISHSFESGKIYGIIGQSGSGKTTLLSLLAGLTDPTSGSVEFNSSNLKDINKYKYRSQDVGVIFQSFNLLPNLTVADNIILSMDASRKKFGQSKKEIVTNLLRRVDLDLSYSNKKILHLSGGEQQRVAIARALSYDPQVILADEPTGNLDTKTQDEIIDIFTELARKDNKCIIIVTHSSEVSSHCDGTLQLEKKRK